MSCDARACCVRGSQLQLSSDVHGEQLRPFSSQLANLVAIADWRTGLPYSILNESLDFVGLRNSVRLPNYFRLDLGIEHRFRVLKLQPWIGVRAYNALNSFLPSDVQANTASPNFGGLYNSQFRQYRLQIRFER